MDDKGKTSGASSKNVVVVPVPKLKPEKKSSEGMVAIIVKSILLFVLFGFGIVFLLLGLGQELPYVEYQGVKAHSAPAGVVLMVAGVLLAIFWKVKSSSTSNATEGTKTTDTEFHLTAMEPEPMPAPPPKK